MFAYGSLITSEEADHLRASGIRVGVVTSGVDSFYRGGALSQPDALETLRNYVWYIVSLKQHAAVLCEHGVRAYSLPFSVETAWFYPMSVRKSIDVLFIGDLLTPLNVGRRSMLKHLAVDFRVGVVSLQDPGLRSVCYLGHSDDPRRVNRWLNEASDVIGSDLIGDMRALNSRAGRFLFYGNVHFMRQRTAVALSAGSCYSVERHAAVSETFVEDKEIVLHDGMDDLTRRVKLLLDDPERAEELGRMARTRILEAFTTEVRIRQLGEPMGFM